MGLSVGIIRQTESEKKFMIANGYKKSDIIWRFRWFPDNTPHERSKPSGELSAPVATATRDLAIDCIIGKEYGSFTSKQKNILEKIEALFNFLRLLGRFD